MKAYQSIFHNVNKEMIRMTEVNDRKENQGIIPDKEILADKDPVIVPEDPKKKIGVVLPALLIGVVVLSVLVLVAINNM